MKLRSLLGVLAISACAFGTAGAQILSVDFNNVNGAVTSPTQAGFSAFNVSQVNNAGPFTQSYSTSEGNLTVNLFGNGTVMSSRDRGAVPDSGLFTYGNLYRDMLTQVRYTANASPTTVAPTNAAFEITGLAPNTDYEMQIWGWNKNNDNNQTFAWWDMTSTPELMGSFLNIGTNGYVPTSNDQFSVSATVTTDANGVLRFGTTVTGGTAALNGFQLSAIPEPGSIGLLLGASAMLSLGFRRLRRIC